MTDDKTRMPVGESVRDHIRSLKRGGETYDELLLKMAAQFEPSDADEVEDHTVPFVTMDNGEEFDVEVQAANPTQAVQLAGAQTDPEDAVVSTFLTKHGLVGDDE